MRPNKLPESSEVSPEPVRSKDVRHMVKWIAAAAACVVLLLVALVLHRSATSILGPSDTPDFSNMQWEKMTVVYLVRVAENRTQRRKFELPREDVEKARSALNVQSVEGLSIGADDDLRITMANGDVWAGGVVFEDRIHLCLERDNYYSYKVELSDSRFYNTLREMCLAHERRTTPGAGINHIILRTNLDLHSYDILPTKRPQE